MEGSNNGLLYKSLNWIERVGNKILDPLSIFVLLCIAVVIISAIMSFIGVSAIHPRDGSLILPVNILTKPELQKYLSSIVLNFQNFPPMAFVLVMMIGVGVAEKSGLMEAALHRAVSNIPKKIVTPIIVFIALISNVMGDAGYIVLPPLAALVFISVGRHPLIGLFAAFAGVSGGFSANIIISLADVLLASFTIPAAQIIDTSYNASPAMNYYFVIISTFVLTIVGTIVTEKIISPRFDNEYFDKDKKEAIISSDIERKGLKYAGISVIAYFIAVIALCLGASPFMADSAGSIMGINAPFMKGIVPICSVMFLIPGLTYGYITGSVKRDRDVVKMMGQSMSDMGPYIVLAFVAAQFLALFTYSNLGIIIAIKGANLLQTLGFTGAKLIISFVFLAAFINLFMGSASAKWAILAPIFVPMFLLVGYDPALTQMAYRIGDSTTNIITPLLPYMPIILAFVSPYKKDSGLGTIISNMLPYSICFLLSWTLLLLVWYYTGLPLGPR
jgi:aminobenzoyl-glutamate transport protein